MATIPQVAGAIQTILGEVAEAAAKAAGFVRRKSKMTGAGFVQTTVLGWLSNPESTLDELCQTAATLGVKITPPGLHQRFSPQGAECLKEVLIAAVKQLICGQAARIPFLERFEGVYLLDSSILTLPDALADIWPGCGGRVTKNTAAAVKVQVCLEYRRGRLFGPILESARTHDGASSLQGDSLPPGAMRVTDLGYFSLDRFKALHNSGTYWLSLFKMGTAIMDLAGKRLCLDALVRGAKQTEIDLPVLLGDTHRIPSRLLAQRVPPQVAEKRRRQLRERARKRGQTPSAARLQLADWTLLITNAPADLLSLSESCVLYGVRWQIELLFRLWKKDGHLNKSVSGKPWRVLCEVYAKLLAVVVQHWLLLLGLWQHPDRSPTKAAKTIRAHAPALARAISCLEQLCAAISTICQTLEMGCRMNTRRTCPNTYQLLLSLGGPSLA